MSSEEELTRVPELFELLDACEHYLKSVDSFTKGAFISDVYCIKASLDEIQTLSESPQALNFHLKEVHNRILKLATSIPVEDPYVSKWVQRSVPFNQNQNEDLLVDDDEIELDMRKSVPVIIGRGGFGSVYRGKFQQRKVAIKCIFLGEVKVKATMSTFHREAGILTSLVHPNIVGIHAYSLPVNECNKAEGQLIMELLDASLKDMVAQRHERFPHLQEGQSENFESYNEIQAALNDVAKGMVYLHGRNPRVVHRDLKPNNIMVKFFPDGTARWKIIDFGLASVNHTSNLSQRAQGTRTYLAPESFTLEANHYSDVYAFAITAWEVLHGEFVCDKFRTLLENLQSHVVNNNWRPSTSTKIPPVFSKLIDLCWKQDPQHRPEFREIAIFFRMLEEGGELAMASSMETFQSLHSAQTATPPMATSTSTTTANANTNTNTNTNTNANTNTHANANANANTNANTNTTTSKVPSQPNSDGQSKQEEGLRWLKKLGKNVRENLEGIGKAIKETHEKTEYRTLGPYAYSEPIGPYHPLYSSQQSQMFFSHSATPPYTPQYPSHSYPQPYQQQQEPKPNVQQAGHPEEPQQETQDGQQKGIEEDWDKLEDYDFTGKDDNDVDAYVVDRGHDDIDDSNNNPRKGMDSAHCNDSVATQYSSSYDTLSSNGESFYNTDSLSNLEDSEDNDKSVDGNVKTIRDMGVDKPNSEIRDILLRCNNNIHEALNIITSKTPSEQPHVLEFSALAFKF